MKNILFKYVGMCDRRMRGFSRAGRAIGENPQSMGGMFLEGMRFPAMGGWAIVLSSFGQGGWMRVRGMGCFPNEGLQQPVGQPVALRLLVTSAMALSVALDFRCRKYIIMVGE